MDPKKENGIKRAAESLKKEYIVVGKAHVRAWHLWLGLGVVAGIVAGVFYVANRSGKFEPSSAATSRSITVISPNGGETFPLGSTQTISWSSVNAPSGAQVALTLEDTEKGINGSLMSIAQHLPASGSYTWTVTGKLCMINSVKCYALKPGSYKVIAGFSYKGYCSTENICTAIDTSDAPFGVVSATP